MYLSDNDEGLGKLKFGKKFRKLGNILQTVAPIALSFVPVVGWAGAAAMIASKAIAARKQMVAAKDARNLEQKMIEEQLNQQQAYQQASMQQSSAQSIVEGQPARPTYVRSPSGQLLPVAMPDAPARGFTVSPMMLGAVGAATLALILLTRK